jgi:hypothetical protein
LPWKVKLGSPAKVAALGFFLLPAGIFASATNAARADEISMQDMSEQGVRDAFTAQLGAMVSGDTTAISGMLDDGFVLTHLTGYRQPKDEWLAQMREGRFIYHRMDEVSVAVEMNGKYARLTAQTQTDSTVSGTRRQGGWRLQMVQDYAWRDGKWIALNCVTSIW